MLLCSEETGGGNDGMFSQLMEGAVEQETAQEKRLRLAKEYLSKLEEEGVCVCVSVCACV